MTTWLVTRHPGARAWLEQQKQAGGRAVTHLDTTVIQSGDLVIGTLPVPLAAEVCSRGARYLHLRVDLPAHQRGVELDAEQMTALGAVLQEFSVTSASSSPSKEQA